MITLGRSLFPPRPTLVHHLSPPRGITTLSLSCLCHLTRPSIGLGCVLSQALGDWSASVDKVSHHAFLEAMSCELSSCSMRLHEIDVCVVARLYCATAGGLKLPLLSYFASDTTLWLETEAG